MILKAADDAGRIDKYISENVPELTRSKVKGLIEDGNVLVNGMIKDASYKVRSGDMIELILPDQPEEIDLVPQDIPIDIIYQDSDIAVINKQQGLVVHPAAGNPDHTLVNAIMFHIKDLSGINGELRPGIVHRIDKDTSGLLVIAKNDAAHLSLQAQIQEKTAKRHYIALVHGNIKEDDGTVDAPIGRHPTDRKKMAIVRNGREAVTLFHVLKRFSGKYTLIRCTLMTGRTHQIRVHMKSLGHSIVGDMTYGRQNEPFHLKGQLLHAYKLELDHPRTGKRMVFIAPLPCYFVDVLKKLNS